MGLLLLSSVCLATEPQLISLSGQRPQTNFNGSIVVFESMQPMTEDDENKARDIYLYDRSSKSLERIVNSDDTRANGGAFISEDGKYVAYHSYPYEVVKGTGPRMSDIFLYDRSKNRHVRVVSADEGEALFPFLSQGGRHVLFTSSLVSKPYRRVYFYDRYARVLDLLSHNAAGEPANGSCGDAKMSDSGRFVFFKSVATNLDVERSTDVLASHLYRLDRFKGTFFRIDRFDRAVGRYDIDGTGRVVVLEGRIRSETNPNAALENSDLYIYEPSSGTLTQLTTDLFERRSHSPTLSKDGRYLGFILRASPEFNDEGGVVVYDRKQDIWRKAVNGNCHNPVFSRNGKVLVFQMEILEKKRKTSGIYAIPNPFEENNNGSD